MVSCLRLEDIESIEYTTCNEVYDLTVEDNHNYFLDVGKPILVHNSGKSFIIIYCIIIRMLKYPGSHHLAIRLRFNHIKQSLAYQTIPDVLKKCFPEVKSEFNKSDWFFEIEGSKLWIGGLDSKDRMEKILGNEYATIFINEGSQIGYDGYELLKTRLNPPKDVKGRLVVDYNPPSMRHWGYKIFEKRLNPNSNQPLKNQERYASLIMNPTDNRENLSDDYILTLDSLSEAKQRRFKNGFYSDDSENALWKREWIAQNRYTKMPVKIDRKVIGVDPAVTGAETSDDTGIVIAGSFMLDGEKHFVVEGDFTYHGGVTGWAKEVCRLYDDYMCDKIVGEVNNGGDLVEANIRNYNRSISYQSVRATRGKAVRAEPIADLYRRGLVHHVGVFTELEDMMCTWTPEDTESPDNMDAMVWAIAYLMGMGSGQMSTPKMSIY